MSPMIRNSLLIMALTMMANFVSLAFADFLPVDDFDTLTLGPIDDQDGWNALHDTSIVTFDPAGGANQVLAVATDSTWLYKNAVIANGTVRVLFVRFRFAGQQNYSFGMSDVNSPDRFGHFEVELSMTNATNELRVNDGGTYDVLRLLSPNVWYNVWLQIDNQNDFTRIYLHDRPGQAATQFDLLDIDGQTEFVFRDGTAGNLLNFFIKTGGGSGPSGPLNLDDIYLEDTDALNLSNPAGAVECIGDIDGDGVTNLSDLAELLGAYGAVSQDPNYNPAADFDENGLIDLADLAFLLGDYGCGVRTG